MNHHQTRMDYAFGIDHLYLSLSTHVTVLIRAHVWDIRLLHQLRYTGIFVKTNRGRTVASKSRPILLLNSKLNGCQK